MELQNNTTMTQRALGQYTRTGKLKPKSSKDKNTIHYRRLILNNVMDILESTFPLTLEYIGATKFTKLVKDFFAKNPCVSPQFWQMPKEFLDYVQQKHEELLTAFPPIINLMEIEWMEVEVFMMPDETMPSFSEIGDIHTDKLVANPEMRILPLNYPVFSKKVSDIKLEDYSQYFISLHRNVLDKQVSQNELGLIQVEVLLYLHEQNADIDSIFKYIISNPNYQTYTKNELVEFCKFCHEKDLIIGYCK